MRRYPDPPDPLADEPEPPAGRHGHGCDNGWRNVSEAYVLKQLGRTDLTLEQRERIALSIVYPCRVCNPDLFYRWVERHLDPDHDPGGCAECSEAKGGRKRRRPGANRPAPNGPPPPEPEPPRERADLA